MDDPTTSEGYVALRNALIAIQDDVSAVHSVLSAVSDGGAGWVQTAYFELRRALVQGQLKKAETVGRLIALILEFKNPDDVDVELSETRLHREGMRSLEEGIGAILAQDNLTGLSHLEALTEAVYGPESLRWVAWYWLARGASDEGNLERAMKASQEALLLAKGLDDQARATSLCRLADVEFLRTEYDGALEHATEAASIFEKTGDRRGLAVAALALARMLDKLDRDADALEAARRAGEADPDWEDPVVYLSQRALAWGDLEEAESVLEPFLSEPRSPEVDRQARLVEAVRTEKVPRGVAVDFLKLRTQPATDETVEAIEVLWHEHREFLELRELLAWNLVKVGREEEASAHFKEMASQDLEPEIRASVMLGLGCLANRQFKHRQPGARVHAAAEAFSRASEESSAAEREFDDTDVTPEVVDVQVALDASFEFDPEALDDAVDQLTIHEETDLTPPPPKPAAPMIAAATPGAPTPAPPSTPPPIPADARPAKPRSKAVFTGSLQLFAVPDLLDFLATSRRTGTLVITSEHGIGAVHMKDGFIAGAAAPNSTNMGDLLLKQEALTEDRLREAVEKQKAEGSNRLLGSILLELGMVEREQLRKALDQQARGALREMVEWTSGRFAFEPDRNGDEAPGEIELNLDTRGVLLDVLRAYDEANK
jgi:tetratricopeptide (TPR) repeat protein